MCQLKSENIAFPELKAWLLHWWLTGQANVREPEGVYFTPRCTPVLVLSGARSCLKLMITAHIAVYNTCPHHTGAHVKLFKMQSMFYNLHIEAETLYSQNITINFSTVGVVFVLSGDLVDLTVCVYPAKKRNRE